MNKNRLWVIGAILVIVAIIGGGWMIGIQPQLAATASTNQNLATVEAQNSANEVLLARLKKDYEGIDALNAQLDSLRTAVPTAAEMPSFVTELNALASAHQVIVKSIAVNDAKSYAPTSAPSNGTHQEALTTNAKITTANFVVIPVQFSVTGTYAKVLDFVHDVQNGQRLFLVATLTTAKSANSAGVATAKKPSVSAPATVDSMIGGFVYVLLDTAKK